jgi:D-alanine-D-alanine ligase
MTEDGQFYLLEANPNPQIAHKEDFADSAEYSGVRTISCSRRSLPWGLNYAGARNIRHLQQSFSELTADWDSI